MERTLRTVNAGVTALIHLVGTLVLAGAVMLGVGGALGAVLSVATADRPGFWVPMGIASFLLGMCLLVVMHFVITTIYCWPRSSRRPLPGRRKLTQ